MPNPGFAMRQVKIPRKHAQLNLRVPLFIPGYDLTQPFQIGLQCNATVH
jgi:hypothetical protein